MLGLDEGCPVVARNFDGLFAVLPFDVEVGDVQERFLFDRSFSCRCLDLDDDSLVVAGDAFQPVEAVENLLVVLSSDVKEFAGRYLVVVEDGVGEVPVGGYKPNAWDDAGDGDAIWLPKS